jgi:hypothetical protein
MFPAIRLMVKSGINFQEMGVAGIQMAACFIIPSDLQMVYI